MLKYVSKFAMDILPSVVATILGAYIVNHYIATKPGTDAPAAAAISSVEPKKKPDIKRDATVLEAAPDTANIPGPGVRAKGISERAMLEKTAAEKPTVVEKPAVVEKPVEKSADKPAETASIPVETRRQQPAPREKTVAKTVAPPMQPPVSAAPPVVAAPNSVEATVVPEERRDANDLARAAIERLRGTAGVAARAPEAVRAPETSRVVTAPAPPVLAPAARPLPPPIMVSTPAPVTYGAGPSQVRAPYASTARIDDPQRPTPPADIPDASPLDLRAEAANPAPREHTTVAEEVLSAAKSVFHAVLPK